MAKQTFTTGQVLTAAQMTSLQQTAMGGGSATAKTASYVLVAADAGTTVAMNAAGATTITVNTGLFAAGDTVFIQNLGAGACTVTAGTATVATAGSLILPQNDAGILYFTATGASIFYDYIQAGAVSPLTTKGDLYTFSTSDARIGVGANNTVLTADSAEATGLKWATPAGASQSYSLLSTTSLSGSSTTISGLSGYNKLLILVSSASSTSAATELYMTINGSSTATDYAQVGARVMANNPYSASDAVRSLNNFQNVGNLKWGNIGAATNVLSGFMAFEGANSSGIKRFSHASSGAGFTTQDQVGLSTGGTFNDTAAISSITFAWQSGTLDAGTVYIYVSN